MKKVLIVNVNAIISIPNQQTHDDTTYKQQPLLDTHTHTHTHSDTADGDYDGESVETSVHCIAVVE